MVYTHDLKSCLVRDVGSSPTTGKMNEVNFVGEQANCFACVWDSNRMTQCHSAEFSIRKLSPTTGKMNEVNFVGEQANCFACVWDSNRMTQCHSAEFSIRKLSPTTGKMNEEHVAHLILRQKLSILKMFLLRLVSSVGRAAPS